MANTNQPEAGADGRDPSARAAAARRVTIRCPAQLQERALADLRRAHPFAYERVGFFFGRSAAAVGIVLLNDFVSVADDEYIQDHTIGARIGREPIRAAMQRALARDEAVFHVHLHAHGGRTMFSGVDIREMATLLPSFHAVAPNLLHGAIVLSLTHGSATVWQSNGARLTPADITLIGYPTRLWRAGL